MPTSSLHVAPQIIHLVHTADPHRRVLDVGPGWGKYATLLREYLDDPPEVIDAVEAWAPYIEDHNLRALYRQVYRADVLDLTDRVLAAYDVVLMVDVIEHLDLGDGFDLLARIPGRVVISTPATFFDNGPGLPPTETHRSLWLPEHFDALRQVRPVESWTREHGAHLVRLGPIP